MTARDVYMFVYTYFFARVSIKIISITIMTTTDILKHLKFTLIWSCWKFIGKGYIVFTNQRQKIRSSKTIKLSANIKHLEFYFNAPLVTPKRKWKNSPSLPMGIKKFWACKQSKPKWFEVKWTQTIEPSPSAWKHLAWQLQFWQGTPQLWPQLPWGF